MSAALVLAINDHVLKYAAWFPSPVAGKLSDLVGVFVAPLLIVALGQGLCHLLGRRAPRRALTLAALASTGVAFSALKLSPLVNHLANQWWGWIVADPTDVFVLPVLFLSSAWLGRRTPRARARRELSYFALGATLWACVATPAPPPALYTLERNYPRWQPLHTDPAGLGCVALDGWVAKSGKQGVGVTFEVTSACEQPVRVVLNPGPLRLAESMTRLERREAATTGRLHGDAAATLAPGESLHRYVSYAFDNERAWNDHERFALIRVTLSYSSGESPRTRGGGDWVMALEHVLPGPYRSVPTAYGQEMQGRAGAAPPAGASPAEVPQTKPGEYLP